MNFKKIIIISILLLILSMAAVSAADSDDNTYGIDSLGADDSSVFTEIQDSENLGESLASFDDSSVFDKKNQDSKKLGESVGTFDDLQFEINNASAGSVLILDRDYTGVYGSKIDLNKDLTIDGQGHTLNRVGNGNHRIFNSNSGNIILKNIRFLGDYNDKDYVDYGGAICIEGSARYTLENCRFENFIANTYGGAIYNAVDNPLYIINSTFINNMANKDKSDSLGGAIYSCGEVKIYDSLFDANKAYEGGAIAANNGAYFSGCTFTSNVAQVGGAVKGSLVTVANSLFEANMAEDYGAIYADCLDIVDSIFKNNYAYHSAGAVFASSYVTINRNQASKKNSYSTLFENNHAGDEGGAIRTDGYVTAVNTRFPANNADIGGAIYAKGNVNLDHCLFDTNNAKSQGGAVFSLEDVSIYNSTFVNNYAEDYGGAIYAKNIFINQNQVYPQTFSSFFTNNKVDDDDGGAIYAKGTVTASNALFSSNVADDGNGGAIYANDVNANNCAFNNNHADDDGGAIFAKNNVNVYACSFNSNDVDDDGGAIYTNTITLAYVPSYFVGNLAHKGKGGAIYANKFNQDVKYASFINNDASCDDGGAIYINSECWLSFETCYFANNHCGDEGGAIYLDSRSSKLSLIHNIFLSNGADDKGTAVYNCGKYLIINNNWWGTDFPDFANALVEYSGVSHVGHYDTDSLKARLTIGSTNAGVNCSVPVKIELVSAFDESVSPNLIGLENFAFSSNGLGGFSDYKYFNNGFSALFTPKERGTHEISINGLFNPASEVFAYLNVDNSSSGDNKSQVIQNTDLSFSHFQRFVDGSLDEGVIDLKNDFIYYGGDLILNSREGIIIDKNILIDGHGHSFNAKYLSGIFQSSEGVITLRNIVFKNAYQQSGDDGGALRILGDARYTIINCTFDSNKAYQDGGAIYNEGGALTVIDSTFVNNRVEGASSAYNRDGGAIHSKESLTIKNCVFKNNSGDNGGAVFAAKSLTVDNCVFMNNYALDNGGAIYATGGFTLVNTPSRFEGNTAYKGKGGAIYTNKFDNDVKYAYFIGNRAGDGATISDDGGAIYINNECWLSFESCYFVNNHCTDEGGAIYLDSRNSKLSLVNNVFFNNVADDEGTAVFNCGKYVTIKNNWWGEDFPEFNNVLVEWYGGVHSNQNHFDEDSLRGRLIIGAKTVGLNSSVELQFSLVSAFDENVHPKIIGLENFMFSANPLGEYSNYRYEDNGFKAIYTPKELGNHQISVKYLFNPGKEMSAYLIVNNSASPDYNPQIIMNTDLSFTNFQTTINNAPEGSVINLKNDYYYFDGQDSLLNDKEGIIINKNIAINGQGHCFDAKSMSGIFQSVLGSITLRNIVFKRGNQESADDGGALRILDDARYTIYNCTFDSNHALQDGGAIFNTGHDLFISDCTFINNRAEGSKGLSNCDGGAIHTKAFAYIVNCMFRGNYANNNGGAIYATGNLQISSLYSSSFESNTAYKGKGGAIYTNLFTNDVKYAVFFNNSAGEGALTSDDGGAIYINNGNTVTFSQCAFIINHCSDEGGAIYLDSTDSHLTLKNNFFLGNSANDEGQVVFNKGHYDAVTDNWWGDNLPSEDNDLLVEWEFFGSNDHRVDSNPVYLKLSLDKFVSSVGDNVWATVCFYRYDGSLCNGEMYTSLISFPSSIYVDFSNRTDYKNYVKILVKPQREGLLTVVANLYGQFAPALLYVNGFSQNLDSNVSTKSSAKFNENNYTYNYNSASADAVSVGSGAKFNDKNYNFASADAVSVESDAKFN